MCVAQATRPAAPPQTPRQALLEVITAKDSSAALRRHLPEATKGYWSAHLNQVPSLLAMGMAEAVAGSDGSGITGVSVERPEADPNLETFAAGAILARKRDPRSQTTAELRIDADDLAGDRDTMELSLHFTGPEGEEDVSSIQVPSIRVDMKQEQGIWRFEEIDFTQKLPLGDPSFVKLTARRQAEEAQFMAIDAVRSVVTSEAEYLRRTGRKEYSCSLSLLAPKSDNSDAARSLNASLRFIEEKGYRIQLTDCSAASFRVVAIPQQSGQPIFCADQSGSIKSATGTAAQCIASGQPVRQPQGESEVVSPK
jgi:hypothetical protein